MRGVGLEPTRSCLRQDLNLVRLPISPPARGAWRAGDRSARSPGTKRGPAEGCRRSRPRRRRLGRVAAPRAVDPQGLCGWEAREFIALTVPGPVRDNSRVAVEHYENFPVASILCPPRLRGAVMAVYRFARTGDDIADEGEADTLTRHADLQAYRRELQTIWQGRPPSPRWRAVYEPLARQRHRLPLQPMLDLLDAFEQDIRNPAYPDRASLLDYCRRSANPVGRLMLHLHGVDDARALDRSDCVCTALQLINFWQDIGVDLARGRIYVPREDARRHGVDLNDPQNLRDGPATRGMLRELCAWARALMLRGAPLALTLPGRSGWELRLVVQGGLRVLDKIARLDHATLVQRPALNWSDTLPMAWQAAVMGWRQPHRAALR